MSQKFQLAQLNVADARGDQSSNVMQGFVNRLGEIQLLADNSPGFVWRYKEDESDDVSERIFGNTSLLINMSVWDDIDSLRHFVYKTTHKELIQSRNDWFKKMPELYQVLWWVPAGHIPGVQEAKDKLYLLREIGPSAEAFTFAKPFEPQF